MTNKLFALLAAIALASPALAQEEGAGDAASQIAAGNPLQIPPGIYAATAERLEQFFAATNGARTIFAKDLKARIDAGVPQFVLDTRLEPDPVLFKAENLARLPLDGTPIVVICHTGHTASMALGGLVALGYNPYVLRFAMMGWNASSNQKIYTSSSTQTIYGLGGPIEK